MFLETGQGGSPLEELKDWSIGPDDATPFLETEGAGAAVASGPPRQLGGNRLERLVGRGGMGEVWLAFDPKLERHVAIKTMAPGLAASPDAVARFYREARAVARLNHPHIVQIHQVGEEEGAPFFAMEWVDGETLGDRLRREAPLPLADALALLQQAVDGLGYACANGVAHRDVKPGNMLIDKAGRLKIADFGLARFLDSDASSATATGVPMGSPNYMSPEQARGETADHRSDIYSLGITLFQMLTGQLPHAGSTPVSILLKHVQEPLPEPELLQALDDGRPLDLIRRMTAKRPEERFQTYEEFQAALSAVRSGVSGVPALPFCHAQPGGAGEWSAATASQAPAAAPPAKPSYRLSWKSAAVVTLIALLVGAALGVGIAGWKKLDNRRRQSAAAKARQTQANRPAVAEKAAETPQGRAAASGRIRPTEAARPSGGSAGRRIASRPGRPDSPAGEKTQLLLERREEFYKFAADNDFLAAAALIEQMLTTRGVAEQGDMEIHRQLDSARALAELRKTLTEQSAAQAPLKVSLPGRGEATLMGPTMEGFRFKFPNGDREVTWSELHPSEILALASHLQPASPKQKRWEAAFRILFPAMRSATR